MTDKRSGKNIRSQKNKYYNIYYLIFCDVFISLLLLLLFFFFNCVGIQVNCVSNELCFFRCSLFDKKKYIIVIYLYQIDSCYLKLVIYNDIFYISFDQKIFGQKFLKIYTYFDII